MGAQSLGQITPVIGPSGTHSAHTADTLLAAVYDQLRKLAQKRMADERTGHSLSATSLVHEAYLRLAKSGQVKWSGKGEFFFAAAEAMRRILIEHARSRKLLKHGNGNIHRLPRSVLDLADSEDFEQVVTLDDAVTRFEQISPCGAAVVRLRFYAGLSVVETAEALGISASTAKREWTYARAWLARELEET